MNPRYLDRLKADLVEGRVVAVIGSGVSSAATGRAPTASWKGLLESGLDHCLAADSTSDESWAAYIRHGIESRQSDLLLSVAGLIAKRLGAPKGNRYFRWLEEAIGTLKVNDPAVIEAISSLNVRLATTNYDSLLEQATGMESITWLDQPQAHRFAKPGGNGILHLHGYWRNPETVILDEASYERLRLDEFARTILNSLATSNSLLFIGCGDGLDDPHFERLLRWIREIFKNSDEYHYRLYCSAEEASIKRQHPQPNDKIQPIIYGAEYPDLPGFLRNLKTPEPAKPVKIVAPTLISLGVPPPPPEHFYGRDAELNLLVTALCSHLPVHVPVNGRAGAGKTTLTRAAFYDPQVQQKFGKRRYFVECESAQTADVILGEIARELRLKPELELLVQVLQELQRAPTLLVLDNLETAWHGDCKSTERMLGHLGTLPNLALVASLRGTERPQGLRWSEAITLEHLNKSAAAEVFLEIAGRKFKDDPRLEQLLTAVDCLPLAVMLLACQAEGEPDLRTIWKRWDEERTEMLKRPGERSREFNLEVALEVSICSPRMTDEARQFMALLASLPEGIASEDAGVLLPGHGDAAATILRKLSLAVREDARHRLYGLVREYVQRTYLDLLSEDELRRSDSYFLGFLSQDTRRTNDQLKSELRNLEAVILRAIARPDSLIGIEAALTLTELTFAKESCQILLPAALKRARTVDDPNWLPRVLRKLGDSAMTRSEYEEVRQYFEEALELSRKADDPKSSAYCLRKIGEAAYRGKLDGVTPQLLYEEALLLSRQARDVEGEAYCNLGLAEITLDRGQLEEARVLYESSMASFDSSNNKLGVANCRRSLGFIASKQSNPVVARANFEAALVDYRTAGEVIGEANCITNLGELAFARGDYFSANKQFEEAEALYRLLDKPEGVGNCVRKRGEVSLRLGDYGTARELLEQALEIYRPNKAKFGQGLCFKALGEVAETEGSRIEAADLYRRSLEIFEEIQHRRLITELRDRIARIEPELRDSED